MSPDPYLSDFGEKTVHRYSLGSGKQGKENIAKLIALVNSIQQVGTVHSACQQNCMLNT